MATRVLLVDPDEIVVAAFARCLKREGFDVLTASNERDCVRHLCESAPNVLVLEPDRGTEWSRRLFMFPAGRTLPAVPIVVVSRCDQDDVQLDPEVSICCWMTKPVTTAQLAAALYEVLETRS